MKTWLFLFLTAVSIGCIAEDNLHGSIHARAYESAMADLLGLECFEDDAAIEQAIRDGRLVSVPNNRYVKRHKNLPEKYAYVLPHVRDRLIEKGMESRKRSGKPIIVTSAVRPKTYQIELGKRNRNAAPTDGPFASTHSTGSTVDIGYKRLKRREVAWLMRASSQMESRGEVQATKERHQACFHIMIYPSTPNIKIAAAEKNNATP
jgi:hypothetical protein